MLKILNNKRKRILLIGLFLLIVFCCVGTAYGSTISISPQISTAPVGDNFTIDIFIDPTGSEIIAAQFDLYFDKNLLEAIEQTQGTFLSQDGKSTNVINNDINNTIGTIKYAEFIIGDIGGVTGSGILSSIKFKVIGTGTSDLTFTNVKISDQDILPIIVEITNGTFSNSEPIKDLEISEITVKHNYYDGAWDNLVNTVNVTVANTGDVDAASFNIVLYADDIEVDTISIPGLAAGINTVVSFNWTPAEANIYTLKAVAENAEFTISQEVHHNGYAGDKPLITYAHGTVTGDLYYSHGDSFYSGKLYPGNTFTVTHEVNLPSGASVEFARLYNYWTWSVSGTTGQYPIMTLTLNDNAISPDQQYADRKGWGSAYDYPAGTWAYNVTSQVTGSGTYTTVVTNTDSDPASYICMDGIGLLIVCSDPSGQEVEYWINEGADMLSTEDTSGGITAEEATTTSPFSGSVDLSSVESARLWTIIQSGGNTGNELIFNAEEWTGVYDATPYADLDIDEARDVTSHLVASNNIAKIQAAPESTGGDYLMPSNAFLVLTYNGTPSPKLSITSDPTTVTVGVPTDVTFTVTDGTTTVEGADITLTGCATGSDTTCSAGTTIITVNATNEGIITATATKDGYTNVTTTLTAKEEKEEGVSSSVSIGANILPAIALEVTPENVSFGELSPGETSMSHTLTLTNEGGLDFDITADVTDTVDGLFKDGLLLDADAWNNFSISITAESSNTTETSLAVPGDYTGVGSKEGRLVFWAEA